MALTPMYRLLTVEVRELRSRLIVPRISLSTGTVSLRLRTLLRKKLFRLKILCIQTRSAIIAVMVLPGFNGQ